MGDWYRLDTNTVLSDLQAHPDGLSSDEAAKRLEQYGPNRLEERRLRSPWSVLLGQFTEVMVVLLIVAAVVSLLIGETTDAIMILVIVVLNALLGFTQEYRAERAMAALRKLATPTVRVRRDGQIREVGVESLVPGDIVLLEAGDRVPADARLIEVANLRIEEAALTGESVPVSKSIMPIEGESVPLGDRINMAFMGTAVAYGRGNAVVTGTGMQTELGRIADMLQEVGEEKTPLQRRMAELGKWLALGALVLVAIVFALGVWRGEPIATVFLTAVSLAVAAVPEGLPAVVTIALALGAQRMVRRNALIRKLPAVETLGSVTTICSDKTGTLTENRMTVTVLDVAGESINLVEQLRVAGPIIAPDEAPLGRPQPSIGLLLAGGSLCNDATLQPDESGRGGYYALGDPTEGALVVAAARMGLWKPQLESILPRIGEAPFTSERKRMTTVHRQSEEVAQVTDPAMRMVLDQLPDAAYIAFTKGSVDGLLSVSDRVWNVDRIVPLDEEWKRRIQEANNGLAAEGTRVLGVAMRPLAEEIENWPEEALEQNLIFVGMSGMIDPPRAEVRIAVAQCRSAGIRPVMITGDHPLTALSIARDLGIIGTGNGEARAITGQELAEMTVEDLEREVEQVSVYARVSP
ncbi:MAG: cation-translocating P-type ATPase [Anaerolineae bacterium]